MKRATLEASEERFQVFYTVDGNRGAITADNTETLVHIATMFSGQPATLRPDQGDPIPVYVMSGRINIANTAGMGHVTFITRTD